MVRVEKLLLSRGYNVKQPVSEVSEIPEGASMIRHACTVTKEIILLPRCFSDAGVPYFYCQACGKLIVRNTGMDEEADKQCERMEIERRRAFRNGGESYGRW